MAHTSRIPSSSPSTGTPYSPPRQRASSSSTTRRPTTAPAYSQFGNNNNHHPSTSSSLISSQTTRRSSSTTTTRPSTANNATTILSSSQSPPLNGIVGTGAGGIPGITERSSEEAEFEDLIKRSDTLKMTLTPSRFRQNSANGGMNVSGGGVSVVVSKTPMHVLFLALLGW